MLNGPHKTSLCYRRPTLSFFELLPYDIRAVIYGYLIPSALPPFARSFHISTSGFILSCRGAKKDIEDIASKRLAKYLANFASTLSKSNSLKISISPVPEYCTLAQLRQITVSVPFPGPDFLHDSNRNPTWKDEFLAILHPLLAQYFDKIHLRFCGGENRPAHDTLLDRGRVEVKMHGFVRGVTYLIERVNRDKSDDENNNTGFTTGEVFKREPGKQEKTGPKPRVNTKRICLSWNLARDGSGSEADSIVLNGKMHRNIVCGLTFGHGTQNTLPIFYHLRDEQRLAGEMGVESARRWNSAGDMELIRLLNGVSTSYEYCSSRGPGKELITGLVGVCASDFEDCEEEVGQLIYN